MSTQNNYRIPPIEMSVAVISIIIGVGILTLPRALAEEMDTAGGWISIMISGLFVMLFVYLYARLQRHFPGQELLQFIGNGKIGKWLSKILSLLFLLYWVCILAYVVRISSLVIKMYLLPRTPSEIIVALTLLTITYAISTGLQGVIHLNLLFFPIVMISLLVLNAFNIVNLHLEYLLPILPEGVTPILSGIPQTLFSFLGVEIIFFLFAYMKKTDIRATPITISVVIVTLLYVIVTIATFSIYGVDKTKILTFPTIESAKLIETPGGIFERLESLMISIWIMTVFNTMTMVHFLTVHIVKKYLIKKRLGMWLPALLAFLTFMIAFVPNSISEAFSQGDVVARFGASLIISTLICGYIIFWWRKGKNKSQGRRSEA